MTYKLDTLTRQRLQELVFYDKVTRQQLHGEFTNHDV